MFSLLGLFSTLLFLVIIILCFDCFFTLFTHSPDLLSSYECGFEPLSLNHVPFCIKFFLLSILFIVFDIEIAYLVPTLYSSFTVLSFLFIIFLGLLFEYSYGSLSWVF